MKTNISHKDIEHFYITLYFSKRHSDCKKKAIWRAYRDFCRTLRNLSQNHQEVKNKWEKLLCNLIEEVCQNDFNEKQFDEWHKENTEKLKKYSLDYTLTIGQAQKWINMTLKYCFLLGEEKIPGITKNVDYFHIPIDNIIQDRIFEEFKINRIDESWSRIDCYSKYMEYQEKFREKISENETPFEVEFKMFNENF